MAKTEPVTESPSDEGRETNLIPLFGAASKGSPDENIPPPTWDSADEVDVSDLPSTVPDESSQSHPLGDFGFTGTFISEDIVLAGSLEVKQNKVTLWASGTQLASWKASDCRVERLDANQFSIEADDEMIAFTADDPDGLIGAISASQTQRAGTIEAVVPAAAPPRSAVSEVRAPTRVSTKTEARVSGKDESAAKVAEPAARTQSATPLDDEVTPDPAEFSAAPPPVPVSRARRPRMKGFNARVAKAAATEAEAEAAASEVNGAARGRAADGVAATGTEAAVTGSSHWLPVSPATDDEPLAEVELATKALRPKEPRTKEPRQKNTVTIADRITATAKRRYTSAKAKRWQRVDIEQMAIKAGVIAAAIGILTLVALTVLILAGAFRGEREFVAVPTTTIPRSPTTTVVVTTLPPPPTTLFQTDVAELTERWNYLAEQSRPELALFNELTSPFLLSLTPAITLEGVLDPVAGSVVLRATPTGTSEGDAQILTSLGLLIGISDPTLDGPDRRALLETLGLKIQDPQLGGLDGTLNYNGLTYHLAYLADQGVIELRVTPENAAVTTTTAP